MKRFALMCVLVVIAACGDVRQTVIEPTITVTIPGGDTTSHGGGPTTPAVQSVTVTPPTFNLFVGGTYTFNAIVITIGGASPAVTWHIPPCMTTTNAHSAQLVIVAVSACSILTITVTSDFDPTKSGSSTGSIIVGTITCRVITDIGTMQGDSVLTLTVGQKPHPIIFCINPGGQSYPLEFWASSNTGVFLILGVGAVQVTTDGKIFHVGTTAEGWAIAPGSAVVKAQRALTDTSTVVRFTVRVTKP